MTTATTMASLFDAERALESVCEIARTIVDPLTERDSVEDTRIREKQLGGRQRVTVEVLGYRRDGRGTTRDLAIADLLRVVTRDLQRRIDKDQRRVEAMQRRLRLQYPQIAAGSQLLFEDAVARKAAG
jgi:hypothetical protein